MHWTESVIQGHTVWKSPTGHWLVRHTDHWELLHPQRDGIIAFYPTRADGHPPFPSAENKIKPR